MKWVYFLAGIALFVKVLIMPEGTPRGDEVSVVELIVRDSGVANAVSGIIFRNRLFRLQSGEDPVDSELLSFLRVFNMTEGIMTWSHNNIY